MIKIILNTAIINNQFDLKDLFESGKFNTLDNVIKINKFTGKITLYKTKHPLKPIEKQKDK